MTTRVLIRLTSTALLLLLSADCGDGGGGSGPNEKPVAAVGGPYSSTTGTVTFNGSGSSDPDGDALTYAWDFGDGAHGTGAQPSHTYAATGTYTVRLTVTDARSASSDPASTSAQVSNVPPAVNAGADGSVSAGDAVEIAPSFTDGTDGPWSYTINWGDNNTQNGTRNSAGAISATHTYASQGTYKVLVTVTDRFGAAGRDSLTLTATEAFPVILAAGDIADCGPTRWYDDSTGALLKRMPGTVVPLGDNAYNSGTPQEYADCYDPAWGGVKNRTRPVAGNHDYYNPGPAKNADGYYGYFGAAAGDPAKGYYSYTLGSWFVVVLNTGTESSTFIAAGSPQEQWLRAELSSHTQQCTLVMFHHPRFTSSLDRPWLRPEVKALWDASYEYGVDLILNGHDHGYQRFAPQNPDGVADAAYGIRQITNGAGGGEGLYQFGPTVDNLQVRDNTSYGVLKVTLRTSGYDWQFVPITGQSFTDSGSGTCHGRP